MKPITLSDPSLIDTAYGSIANIETIAHSKALFCSLRNRNILSRITVAENKCFDFSGYLEPKSGLLLNFSEQDTHYFNGAPSNTKENDLKITVSRPGRESYFSFLNPYKALFIEIDEVFFKESFELLTHLDYHQFFANDFVQFISHEAKSLTAARIRHLLNAETDPNDLTFLEDLIMSIDPTPVENQRTFCNTLAIQAYSLLMENKHRPLTITELSKTLNAPARSIQQGFKNIYGKGPIDLHNRYRMQCVRDHLRSQNTNHGDLLNIIQDYGFSHQSRFAQSYRQLFGILPSQEKKS